MSDLDSIVGEIDKIMMESDKQVVFDSYDEPSENNLTMEEISATVAGVVMEEFPAGGNADAFGRALVEASIGAAEDLARNPGEILAGMALFFQEAIESAHTFAENYDEDGDFIGEEDDLDDDDLDDDDLDDDEEDDEDEDYEEEPKYKFKPKFKGIKEDDDVNFYDEFGLKD